jgi:hypothetical protein
MMEVFADIQQGSDLWFQVRAGMATASMFKEVIAKKGPRGGLPKGRQTYLRKLAGEILTGEPMPHYTNADMERGHEREAEARDLYAMLRDVEPEQVGFIRNGNCGCSPDALIGSDGMWENKDALAHIQIERLLAGTLPKEHVAQSQGQLMVSDRQWLDFMSYCRGLPPLIVRVERDEKYIAALRVDIDEFVSELDELVTTIRCM